MIPETFTASRPPYYEISTNPKLLDVALIHRYLSNEAYWAKGRTLEQVEQSIASSLNFGLYHQTEGQVGFSRVVTDYSTFAWLCDVFVLESHRGKGLSKWLMECILAQPSLAAMRLFLLGTADAHGLYAQYGFQSLPSPERFMEKRFRP